jgi:hypothetical protein
VVECLPRKRKAVIMLFYCIKMQWQEKEIRTLHTPLTEHSC